MQREGTVMGERSKGKDKGATKKQPKARKAPLRPHEQRQQQDATKRPPQSDG
jgi:hypothetical protein